MSCPNHPSSESFSLTMRAVGVAPTNGTEPMRPRTFTTMLYCACSV